MSTTTTLSMPPPGTALAHAGAEAPCSLLRMAVGDDVLAVPIEDVREILQVSRLTPLPRTPALVSGVMNLRGAVVPVIDLAARLGRPATEVGRRSCIVVVEYHPHATSEDHEDDNAQAHGVFIVGLLVDGVFEVFDRQPGEIEPPPPLGTRIAPEFLRGMTRAGGALVGVLALQQVLAPKVLAAAIAAYQPQ
jgi:purine-binding chemotaxis protein CheW